MPLKPNSILSLMGHGTLKWVQSALLMLVASVFSIGSGAEVVEDLLREAVLVVTQRTAEREEALAEALENVLVRVSGNPSVLENDKVKLAVAAPKRFVESFYYGSTDELIEHQGVTVAASKLVLKFSPTAVEQLMRENSLPLWADNRPTLLVWLVTDDLVEGRRLRRLRDESDAAIAVQSAVKRRGLPIVIPVLDLQDQMALSASQAWQMDMKAIRAASVRYDVDAILVGRYSTTSSGQWISTWSLLNGGEQTVFSAQAADENSLIQSAVDRTANELAINYAVHLGQKSRAPLIMEVQGLTEFKDYADVLYYLDDLTIVRRVELMAMQGTTLWLTLHTEGSVDRLLGALALGEKLQPLPVSGVAFGDLGGSDNPLRYQWPQP